jgi:uncharacterized repeat protein (TIGR01451 family)
MRVVDGWWRTLATASALLAAGLAPAATPPGVAITNTARVMLAVGTGTPYETLSNTTATLVSALTVFDPLRLSVSPDGPVPGGTVLTYTVNARNASGVDLPGAVFRLPLESDILGPEGPAAGLVSPATTSISSTYDPVTRTIVWTSAAPIAKGATVTLTCRVRVRPDAKIPDVVVEAATGRSDLSVADDTSNTVVTPIVEPLLRLTKTVDRAAVAPGDGVVFTLSVEHVGASTPLAAVVAVDALPEPLRYVPGTTRVDGTPAPDPVLSPDGHALRFPLPDMAPGDVHVVRFGARVGPSSDAGEIVNRAFAEAVAPGQTGVSSPPSSAAVRVVPGPFRQEATLIGRVFVDDDADGRPGADEAGVPGALVVLEDGRGAVTDVAGRWHVEGVRPGLHVLRIDPATLPPPLASRVGGADWAGGRGSRFVEARASQLEIADLPVGPARAARCAIGSPRGTLLVPVASLGAGGSDLGPRAEALLDAAAGYLVDLGEVSPGSATVACDDPRVDARALEAVLREHLATRAAVAPEVAPAASHPASGGEAQDGAPGPPKDPLEEVVRTAPPLAAIVYPADGSRAPRGSTNVEVVYPQGSRLDLALNGDLLPMDLVGATSTLPARGVSASRFVGLKLRPGTNVVTFRATPPGADPATVAPVRITIVRPGPTVAVGIAETETRCVADGVTPCSVRIEALDEGGMRSCDDPVATLVVEGARPIDPDADSRTDGFQVHLVDGAALVRLAPPATPGRIRVAAQVERATAERFISVNPSGGPWRVMGLAEVHTASDAGVEGDGGLPPGEAAVSAGTDGRVAVLAQGPVLKASHLTLSIDTARRAYGDRLFDRFRPDEIFPVFGDSGGGLDLAARQGPVYVRLDGPEGFVAAGDFDTAFTGTELARYDRRLEGAWGRAGNAKVAIDAFAASTLQNAARDVFVPDGTSGPYLLSRRPVVAYSQTVIVEVRDRFHPEDVIQRVAKQADLDYALDPDSGTILFRGPVPPFDADLNPLRIVVLYETRDASNEQLTAGARLLGHPVPQLDAGATAVYEAHEGAALELYGVDLTWRVRPGTTVAAEAAATTQAGATAFAYRFEAISQATRALRWEAHYHDVPVGFANPSFLSAPEIGGQRGSAALQWQSQGAWRVRGEALWQNDEVNAASRTVGSVTAERRTELFTVSGALRGVDSDDASGRQQSALAELGVRGRISARWTAELFRAQVLTHDVAPGYPTRTAAGLTWDIKDGQRLSLKEEVESGPGTPRHARTFLGLESRIGAHTRALTSYTLEGGATGAALRSSSGVETVLPLSPKLSVLASAAAVHTNRGDGSADFVALAGGTEYRAGSSLLSARYEVNFNHVDVRHLLTGSGVFRTGPPWTLFVREQVFISDPESGAVAARSEGLLGAAYRPASGPFQFLARLDHAQADGIPRTPGGVTPGGAASEPAGSVAPPARDPGQPGLGIDYARVGPLATRDAIALNVAAGFRIDPRNRLASTVVLRRVGREEATGIGGSFTWLAALHYTAQIADRWTIGASLRRFAQDTSKTALYGNGVEVGYLAFKNLWVTGGYNVTGFHDGGFPSNDRTDKGPFLSLRFKFDEQSLASIRDLRLDRP